MRRPEFITIPAEHARAIREDALAPMSDVARQRAGLDQTYVGLYRVRVRIGVPPVQDIKHMHFPDLQRSTATGMKVYRRRPPRCRACAQPIKHGQEAIAFTFYADESKFGRSGWLIHARVEECGVAS